MISDSPSFTPRATPLLVSTELSAKEFSYISQLVYRISGIQLPPGKEGLVKTRLSKRIRILGVRGFQEYIHLLENEKNGEEMSLMIDLLTTNKTDFFREMPHFHFLSKIVFPSWKETKNIRIWSAGCSTGEEPFSYAIHYFEEMKEPTARDLKLLATDLSVRVLSKARNAAYEEDRVQDIPSPILKKYFAPISGMSPLNYKIADKIRNVVSFAQLNLMGDWPMKGPFHLISCRNVMIYFDKPTVERLVNRFSALLSPGGFFFVGHSESLSSIRHDLEYLQPAVYRKPEIR